MRRALLAAIPLVLLVHGCAATGGRDEGLTGGGAAGARAESREQRYEVDAVVLQDPKHGPELCLGGVRDSLPPQCGGIPIPNWSWDKVGGEEARSGTTWGSFHVVGSYDGSAFTVSEVSGMRAPEVATQDLALRTTCPEPSGGWQPQVKDSAEARLEAVSRVARSAPDFAGLWITYLQPMGDNVAEDPGDFVLNVAFTSDPPGHEAALRQRWSGPLCVVKHARTYRDLTRIQEELTGAVGSSLGLKVLYGSASEVENVVDVTAVVADEAARKAVDERYGPGTVRLRSALQQVEAAAR